MASTVQIKGAKELQRTLRELPRRLATKVNRRAVNLASTGILTAARAEVPEDTAALRKALTKKVTNSGMRANAVIGADADAVDEAGKRPANYDHLVEYGHVAPDGTAVAANPFLQRAWDNSIDAAQQAYTQLLAAGVEQEATR